MGEYRVKMGQVEKKAAAPRRIVNASNIDINAIVARAVRSVTAKTAAKTEKVGMLDRSDAADNVRIASLDLAPVKPTEVPKEARGMAIEDGIVTTLRAGRKPK